MQQQNRNTWTHELIDLVREAWGDPGALARRRIAVYEKEACLAEQLIQALRENIALLDIDRDTLLRERDGWKAKYHALDTEHAKMSASRVVALAAALGRWSTEGFEGLCKDAEKLRYRAIKADEAYAEGRRRERIDALRYIRLEAELAREMSDRLPGWSTPEQYEGFDELAESLEAGLHCIHDAERVYWGMHDDAERVGVLHADWDGYDWVARRMPGHGAPAAGVPVRQQASCDGEEPGGGDGP